MKSNTGIYVFENTKEHKAYIGQSSDLKRRLNYHYFFNLKEHQNEFHQTLKEHPEYFLKSVVEYCTEEELAEKEVYWMNRYESEGWELYNVTRTKQVMGNRNRIFSEEHRRKLSEAHKGKHHSEESKKKLSEKRKGENNPMYGRSGELSPRFGIKHTEASKKKMSENQKGHTSYWKGKTGLYKGKHWRINQETGKREWYE